MNKAVWILIDAVILFAVSTLFVVLANLAFSGLKGKTPADDPVVTAITKGDLKELETEARVSSKFISRTDEHGRTALMRAAYANLSDSKLVAETDGKRAEMIPLLLANGAPIEAKDNDGWTALMWASWSGLSKVTEQLLKLGASHSPTDKKGNSALSLAARRGNANVVRLLLDHGADQSVLDQANTGMAEYPDKEAVYQEIISMLGAR